MELNEAIELIRFQPSENQRQLWADLGCGSGLFSGALASLLPVESTIYAVDKDEKALARIPAKINGVVIEKKLGDFLALDSFFHSLDGLLMANSLHFISNKKSFLRSTFDLLKDDGLFLLVEYDLRTANSWVPFPVTIDEAEFNMVQAGFRSFEVLRKKPSIYGSHYMYAALVRK